MNNFNLFSHDLNVLIQDYLFQEKYLNTLITFEQESNTSLFSFNKEISFFRKLILDGNFSAASNFLLPLKSNEKFNFKESQFLIIFEEILENFEKICNSNDNNEINILKEKINENLIEIKNFSNENKNNNNNIISDFNIKNENKNNVILNEKNIKNNINNNINDNNTNLKKKKKIQKINNNEKKDEQKIDNNNNNNNNINNNNEIKNEITIENNENKELNNKISRESEIVLNEKENNNSNPTNINDNNVNDEEEEEGMPLTYNEIFDRFCNYIIDNKFININEISSQLNISNEEALKKLREMEEEGNIIGFYDQNENYFYLTLKEMELLEKIFNKNKTNYTPSQLNNIFKQIRNESNLLIK